MQVDVGNSRVMDISTQALSNSLIMEFSLMNEKPRIFKHMGHFCIFLETIIKLSTADTFEPMFTMKVCLRWLRAKVPRRTKNLSLPPFLQNQKILNQGSMQTKHTNRFQVMEFYKANIAREDGVIGFRRYCHTLITWSGCVWLRPILPVILWLVIFIFGLAVHWHKKASISPETPTKPTSSHNQSMWEFPDMVKTQSI